ncbi:MAG: GNAT family N-acetyltransferase [Firmicutes bacterium]|nr:GNAT family N-acetyltransferase [Bacillota bacterium]
MKYLTRQLNENDIKPAMDLVWRVFSEFEAPEYLKEGVLGIEKFIDVDSMKERVRNNELILFGAFKTKIIGVILI